MEKSHRWCLGSVGGPREAPCVGAEVKDTSTSVKMSVSCSEKQMRDNAGLD